jgi:hypothetical protein
MVQTGLAPAGGPVVADPQQSRRGPAGAKVSRARRDGNRDIVVPRLFLLASPQ